MEITFVGTGSMGSIERCNTSVLIDNILFDCGMGTTKQLNRLKFPISKVRYIVITHFHADHTFDIPNYLVQRMATGDRDKRLTFIGPVGLRQRIVDMVTMAFADGDNEKYKDIEGINNIDFIEIGNEESVEFDFKLTAYKLLHQTCSEEQGYILEKEGKRIGILWDTTFCDNYEKVCQNVEYVFSDVTRIDTTDAHIGINEFKEFYKKYPEVKFYAIHRTDYSTEGMDGIEFPVDGDKIII